MLPVDLTEKFALIDDHWHPRIVAALNGQLVKLAKGLRRNGVQGPRF